MPSIEQIKSATETILAKNGASFVGLFGSFARGEASEDSDVDLLVTFDPGKSLLDVIGLEQEVSAKLGRKVDLVTTGSLNPYLKDYVMADLKTIYAR